MTTRLPWAFCAGLLALLAVSTAADAGAMQSYTVTDLGSSSYTDLTDLGQAFGVPLDQTGYPTNHQLFYDGTKTVDLGTAYTLRSANDVGQTLVDVNGPYKKVPAPEDHLIREPDGTMHTIPGLGPGETPFAINDKGQVLVADDASYTRNSYSKLGSFSILTNGVRTDAVTDPAAKDTFFHFTGFGPDGQIAGIVQHGETPRVYTFASVTVANGTITNELGDGGEYAKIAYNRAGQSISHPRDSSIYSGIFTNDVFKSMFVLYGKANSINDVGQVVGSSMAIVTGPSQPQYAALFTSQIAQDLNKLLPSSFSGHLDEALKINNRGQILATGTMGGERHSFLLTAQPSPVPEPLPWLVASALVGGGLIARSRRRESCKTVG